MKNEDTIRKETESSLIKMCSDLDDQKIILLSIIDVWKHSKNASGMIQALSNIDLAIRSLEKIIRGL